MYIYLDNGLDWTWFGCSDIRVRKRGQGIARTNDIFPRRHLPRDIHIHPTRARLEKLVFLVRMRRCFFHVELLQGGVAVFDEPVGGVPGGEGGAAGAAAVAGGGGGGQVCCGLGGR